ncbi:MAG: CBS domain-containing protein [bacterium]|jgi:CBS domain-containing protein
MESLKARSYMTTNLITVSPEMNVYDAIKVLVDNKVSGAPVLDEDKNLIGMLSEKDCLKPSLQSAFYNQGGGNLVRDLMSTDLRVVESRTSILRCAEIFLKENYRRLPVLENGKLVGQISRRDILRGMLHSRS